MSNVIDFFERKTQARHDLRRLIESAIGDGGVLHSADAAITSMGIEYAVEQLSRRDDFSESCRAYVDLVRRAESLLTIQRAVLNAELVSGDDFDHWWDISHRRFTLAYSVIIESPLLLAV